MRHSDHRAEAVEGNQLPILGNVGLAPDDPDLLPVPKADPSHRVRRHREILLANPYHQGVGGGHGKGCFHREATTLSRLRFDSHAPPQPGQGLGDHVQSHAPAARLGHFRRRREAGRKEEIEQRLFRGDFRHPGGQESRGHRAPPNFVKGHARAVVFDRHSQQIADDPQRQPDGPSGWLAGRATNRRFLDSVVHRISDQMGERRLDLLEKKPVDLDVAPFDSERDFLSNPSGVLANQSLQCVKEAGSGNRPQRGDVFSKVLRRRLRRLRVRPQRVK